MPGLGQSVRRSSAQKEIKALSHRTYWLGYRLANAGASYRPLTSLIPVGGGRVSWGAGAGFLMQGVPPLKSAAAGLYWILRAASSLTFCSAVPV
jgi:hypothetical protein